MKTRSFVVCALLLIPAWATACQLHVTAVSNFVRHQDSSIAEVHVEVQLQNQGPTACGGDGSELLPSRTAQVGSAPVPSMMSLTPMTTVSGPAVLINATGTPGQSLAGPSHRDLGVYMAFDGNSGGQCGPYGRPLIVAREMLHSYAVCQWDVIAPGQLVNAQAYLIAGESANTSGCLEGVVVLPPQSAPQDPALLPILNRWSACAASKSESNPAAGER